MKKINLIKLLLGLSVIGTIIAGCNTGNIQDVPTANISSVLNILNDDTSGIVWHNETDINLGAPTTFKGKGVSITDSQIRITEGGNYTLTGTLTNGSVTVDTSDTVNLTLKNANITNLSGPAINITGTGTAYVTLISDTKNYLIDGPSYSDASLDGTLTSNAHLIFQGNGSIDITAQYKDAISCDSTVTISNGVFNLSSVQDAVNAEQSLTVNGGSISVIQSANGMSSNDTIAFNNGVLSVASSTNGAYAAKDITVKGSTLNVSDCMSGIRSRSNIVINGGNLNLSTTAASLASENTITINKGNLHLKAADTVVETSGSLIVNGGTTLILADAADKGSINCDNLFTINGGTFLAAGTVGSIPDSSVSTQHTVILDSLSAHTLMHIQSDKQPVMTFMPEQDYEYLLFSSPLLLKNETYSILTGGSTHGGTDFYGLRVNASYKNGLSAYTFTCNDMVSGTERLQVTKDVPDKSASKATVSSPATISSSSSDKPQESLPVESPIPSTEPEQTETPSVESNVDAENVVPEADALPPAVNMENASPFGNHKRDPQSKLKPTAPAEHAEPSQPSDKWPPVLQQDQDKNELIPPDQPTNPAD